jgi:hypothetical protein
MTVAELIEELQKLPPGWPVYVRGYEYGVDDVVSLTLVQARRDVGGSWGGKHEVNIFEVADSDFNGVQIVGDE